MQKNYMLVQYCDEADATHEHCTKEEIAKRFPWIESILPKGYEHFYLTWEDWQTGTEYGPTVMRVSTYHDEIPF